MAEPHAMLAWPHDPARCCWLPDGYTSSNTDRCDKGPDHPVHQIAAGNDLFAAAALSGALAAAEAESDEHKRERYRLMKLISVREVEWDATKAKLAQVRELADAVGHLDADYDLAQTVLEVLDADPRPVAADFEALLRNAESLFHQGIKHFNRAERAESAIARVEAILGYPHERVLVSDVIAALGGTDSRPPADHIAILDGPPVQEAAASADPSSCDHPHTMARFDMTHGAWTQCANCAAELPERTEP